MKRVLLILFIPFFLISCLTTSEETMNTASDDNEPGPRVVRTNGVYLAPYGKIATMCLRFYEDGTVITQTAMGQLDEIVDNFNMNAKNISKGTYEVNVCDELVFTTKSPEVTVEYIARPYYPTIYVMSHSLKNDHRGEREYMFFPDGTKDFSKLALLLPKEQKETKSNPNNVVSFAYIEAVLNHTMDGVEKTVILENETDRITYFPDMKFEWLDKKSEEVISGRDGFVMTPTGTEPSKIYLKIYDDPNSLTRDDFLKSDYQKSAEIILTPIRATNAEVEYQYVKPSDETEDMTFTVKVVN